MVSPLKKVVFSLPFSKQFEHNFEKAFFKNSYIKKKLQLAVLGESVHFI